MFKSKTTKIIVIAVVALLIIILVVMLSRGGNDPKETSSIVRTSSDNATANAATVNADAQELLRILQSLNNLQLDHSFLTSRAFLNLVDYSVVLPVSVSGRRNPFDVVSPEEPPYIGRTGSALPVDPTQTPVDPAGISPSFNTEEVTGGTTTRQVPNPQP